MAETYKRFRASAIARVIRCAQGDAMAYTYKWDLKRTLALMSLLFTFLFLCGTGCATHGLQTSQLLETIAEKLALREADPVSSETTSEEGKFGQVPKIGESLPLSSRPGNSPQISSPQTRTESDQEMLDCALEFCQTSNDFWEQGDLDNALDALDKAYSLVLKVTHSQDPEILQQRDDLRFTISKRIIECYSSRFIVANGYHKAIPVIVNSYVEKELKIFTGSERKFFLEAYRRSGKYRPAIVRALKEAGLPEELSWLPLIESGFKVKALSRARALGLWQFIASTGYKFGLNRDRFIDERMDPEKSTRAAIAYLKELHQIFGDWTTVLAAYNCGEGTVLKRIRTQRINYLDNFWDLYEELPRETACYVPRFLAVLQILNDPEAHGFTLPPVEEEIESEEISIDRVVHLKTMASHLEVDYEVLKDLNPELRYNCTPDRPYTFTVPKGKGATLLAKIDSIPVWHNPIPAYVTHEVKNGESLSVIARRYGTSVKLIMALNKLESRHFIRQGWKLKIPARGKYAAAKSEPEPVPGSATTGNCTRYVVQKGDCLSKVAHQFGTTTKVIQSLNQLNDTRLQIGQVIMIPEGLCL
jgi:membrane-bound lytic murein transglycosylase D